MVKKVLRGIGYVLGALLAIIVVFIGYLYISSSTHFNREYAVDPAPVTVPGSSQAIAQGQHIVESRGCQECHGANLAGGVLIDGVLLGRIAGSNLTAGRGGIGARYTDMDWVRSIRHGIRPNGKPLIFMPANEYYFLSDTDLGALIAYLKSLPPVDVASPGVRIGPLGRALFRFGKMPQLVPAELINHTAERPHAPEPGVTPEYGHYLTRGCGCHGEDLAGAPPVAPDFPPAPSIHMSARTGVWTRDGFIRLMRTGTTPEGKNLMPQFMPWTTFGKLTDNELSAIWTYLETL